jgi:hypothetical protein
LLHPLKTAKLLFRKQESMVWGLSSLITIW